MHAKYSRAALQGEERHGEAAGEPLGNRPPRELPERRLARETREERDAQVAQPVEMRVSLPISTEGRSAARSARCSARRLSRRATIARPAA